jgi:cytoskeletal protein RodZ
MEPLGPKLQQARLAKKITLEDAARVTKIRQARLQDIEAEDFSNFSSLAYAKGFLLIYAKFLGVDVTPYLDAFETSRHVSVDGYSYLQDTPGGAPPTIVHRQAPKRPTLLLFIVAVGVLVLGLYLIKLLLDIQRITPSRPAAPGVVASATPQPSAPATENIIAPRAVPVEGTPSEALVTVAPTATPAATSPSPSEQEVRRALPVHPEDLVAPEVILTTYRVEIKPVRKTYLRVTVDENLKPAFDGWLDPSDPPLSFQGQHVTVKVLERGAVQITKNGAALATGDADVTIE